MSFQPSYRGNHRTQLAAVSLIVTLLLAGCGFFGGSEPEKETETATDVVARPMPPIGPARFANTDGRTYVPDRIVIPTIDLDTPVVDLGWHAATDPGGRVFSRWDVAAFAAGWHVNSGHLGQGGNVVLSGHNNILGAVFRELDQLEVGDVASVWSGGTRYDYTIDKVVIVPDRHATQEQRVANADWIEEFDDDRLTLVSCWPRDDNSHRIIVVGHYVGGDESELSASTESP